MSCMIRLGFELRLGKVKLSFVWVEIVIEEITMGLHSTAIGFVGLSPKTLVLKPVKENIVIKPACHTAKKSNI